MTRYTQGCTFNAMETTQLFTRDGEAYTVQPQQDEKGRPYFVRQNPCSRCGGAGGAEKWRHTGFTCWQCGGSRLGKTEKVRLYTQGQLDKMNAVRDRRRVKVEAQRAEAAAVREQERAAKREQFVAQHGEYFAGIITACGETSPAAAIIATAKNLAALTEAQRTALDSMAAEAQRKAATSFIGEIGERREFTATVKRIMDWSRKNTWPIIHRYCHILADESGNAIKYVGSAYIGREGESVTFKATVEDHETYNGERQTIVARPKLKEEKITPGELNDGEANSF